MFRFGTLDPVVTKTGFPPAIVVHGWAWSTGAPKAGQEPVDVTISVDDRPVLSSSVANVSRPDLVAAGVAPNSNHGFEIGLPPEVCTRALTGRHVISAYARSSDGSEWALTNSPRCICDFVPCSC